MHSKIFLSRFRDEINDIDTKIIQLLSKRKTLILQIAKSKIQNNQEIRDLERERKMLQNLIDFAKKNNLTSEYVIQIFQLIIEESVLTQQALLHNFYNPNQITTSRFSFLGPNGSYSYIAVCKYADRYYKKYITKECATFQDVLISVENNQTDYAILPIENSSSGSIDEVLKILQNTSLFIVGEIHISVNHCLLATSKSTLKNIKTIYSHPQPFKQCSQFLRQFPHWEIKYTNSTTDAMQKIASSNQITNAALGSKIGGNIYKLKVLCENLTNQENNTTRFILLAKHTINVSSKIPSKTTLIFHTKNKEQDIFTISSILQEKNLTMKYMNTINNYQNTEEMIYIDIPSHVSSPLMHEILKKIKNITNHVKVLGCYPSAKIIPATP